MIEAKPLVSIALCSYNGAKYLRNQIDSIVSQTYRPLELIIVDDKSSDNTAEILSLYAENNKDILFRVFENERRLGYVKNFEKAISLCSGDFIAIADQDDVWTTDKIEILMNKLGSHILIYHDSLLIDEQGQSLNKKMSDRFRMYRGRNPKQLLLYNCISGHSCLFRKELKYKFGSFNPMHYYDHWIAYVASNLGTIGFVDQCLVSYRQHQESVITQMSRPGLFFSRKRRAYGKIIEHRNKIKHDISWLKRCKSLEFNKNSWFVKWLYFCMVMRQYSIISVLVFFTLLINQKTIYYSRKPEHEYMKLTHFQFIKKWYFWGLLGIKLRYFWRT
ncbi:MAG TPA: glycosyltransferase family 2 protein [Pseudosphingobacterium sp.]|nr:glycosyltransferase family 2 protein [Pseudosphingobacterium sp.]